MVFSELHINEYNNWLSVLKERVKRSQQRAVMLVNVELLALYRYIGSELDGKIAQANWGDGVVDKLAKDLAIEFPAMKGFSRSNVFNMLKWYRFYAKFQPLVQQAVGLSKEGSDLSLSAIVQQLDGQFPPILSQVPWGHQIVIITKCTTVKEAIFYLQQASMQGWSRNMLLRQMEAGLYTRQVKFLNNFSLTLPRLQSHLAEETHVSKLSSGREKTARLAKNTRRPFLKILR